MLDTPILFLVFNRPDTTKQVFAKIREVKPKQLFVAADGAREYKEGEQAKVDEVRKLILENIDWDCEVKTLFRDKNLGCGKAVSQAITWFFDNVEQGIILEDDCLPDLSFFPFCEELLEKYKDDERVMMISGYNALGSYPSTASYIFSRIGAIWGWATWSRAWKHYDTNNHLWKQVKEQQILENLFIKDTNQTDYRKKVLEKTFNGEIDTWDYFWTFNRLIQMGTSIVSKDNLIQNIGFGEDATHTINRNAALEDVPVHSITSQLTHPLFIYIDELFDNQVYYKTIGYRIFKPTITYKIKQIIKRIIKHA